MSSPAESPTTISCKAAVAWGPGEPLALEEVEVDPPKEMEIRIKIACSSLCRSDVTQWESKAQPSLFPRIFGHEASGVVESIGEGVTEFEVGDHVLTIFIGECKSCKHCVSGKSNMCQKLGLERKGVMHTDQKSRFSIKGRPIYHYCAVSSFSEYTVVHSGCAVKISKNAPMDRICLLSCGVAAGHYAGNPGCSVQYGEKEKPWYRWHYRNLFQGYWGLVKDDISRAVMQFFERSTMPDSWRKTLLVLIPKKELPVKATDYRPISLCTTIHKVVAKILVNRLKPILPNLVSQEQGVSVPSRLISENLLLAQEVINRLHTHTFKVGSMALKIDMKQTYDRIDWQCLAMVMDRLGFQRS